jgi:hypothetical protein
MSIRDFKAKQLRTTSIIGSGSNVGTEPSVLIYSASTATDSVGSRHSDLLTNIGTDVFLFVSGSKTTDSNGNIAHSNNSANRVDTTVFGGDLVVSGVLYAEVLRAEVDMSTTGSLSVEGSLIVTGSTAIGANAPTANTQLYVKGNAGTNGAVLNVAGVSGTGTMINAQDEGSLTTGRIALFDASSNNLNGEVVQVQANGTSTDAYQVLLVKKGNAAGSNSNAIVGLDIDFDMTDGTAGRALRIDSEQTTGVVAEVNADALTTGTAVDVSTDARTTGTALSVSDSATNDNAGSLVKIAQTGNRAGSAASIGLEIDFNTVANSNARALKIDSEQTTGVVAEFDGYEITTGDVVKILADDRQTGSALHVNDTGNGDYAGSLVKIAQTGNRAGSAASTGLEIDFNTVANSNARALKIDSEQTTGIVAEINGDEITTGTAVDVSADKLTTGKGLSLTSTSNSLNGAVLLDVNASGTSTDDYTVVKITKDASNGDNSNAIIGLDIDFDMTAGTAGRAMRIVSDQTTGVVSEMKGDSVDTGAVLVLSGAGVAYAGEVFKVVGRGERTLVEYSQTAANASIPQARFLSSSAVPNLDVSFFVSGSSGDRGDNKGGVSLFAGDVVISGSLTDGDGNPIAGGGTSGSFNEVTVSSETASFVTTASLSIAGGLGFEHDVHEVGTDVYFFVSGTIGEGTSGATGGKKSVFGGDMIVSGGISLLGDLNVGEEAVLPVTASLIDIGFDPSAADNTNLNPTLRLTSHEDTIDSTTKLGIIEFFGQESDATYSGVGAKIQAVGTNEWANPNGGDYHGGSPTRLELWSTSGGGGSGFSGYDYDRDHIRGIVVDGDRVLILSGARSSGNSDPESEYPDMNFFVSGSAGTRNKSVRGTAVFGGDLVVSGVLYGDKGAAIKTLNKEGALIVNTVTDQVLVLSGSSSDDPFDEATGADVAFYVSGTVGSRGTSERGTSLFGGDVAISGSLLVGQLDVDNAEEPVLAVDYENKRVGIGTSSPTYALDVARSDGTLYDASTDYTGGDGQIRVKNTYGTVKSSTGIIFSNSSDSATSGLLSTVDPEQSSGADVVKVILDAHRNDGVVIRGKRGTRSHNQVLILSGGAGDSFDEASGGDVTFYVSGSTGARGTSERGTAVFGGDVYASGNLHVENSLYIETAGSDYRSTISVDSTGDFTLATDGASDNADITLDAEGEIILDAGSYGHARFMNAGDDYLSIHNGHQAAFSIPREAVVFEVTNDSEDFVFAQYDNKQLLRMTDTSQILFLSGGAETSPNEADYTDLAFFVSGAIGSAGTAERGTSVFGGDVVISGTLSGGSPLVIDGDIQVSGTIDISETTALKATALSGSLTHLQDGTSYLIAGSNVTITTGSNGAVTIASTAAGGGSAVSNVGWLSPANQVISTTGSLKIGTADENNPDINLGSDGSAVFNEQGASVDFRVESDNLSHMVFVDGSANQIAIGAPSADITSDAKLVISSSTDTSLLTLNVNTPNVARTNSIMSVISGSAYVFNLDKHGKAVFNPDFANQTNPTVPLDVTFFVSGSTNLSDRHSAAGGVAVFGGNIITSGSIVPGVDSAVDLGTENNRFRNVYTGDLHLRNERGDWTIVEEKDYLCVINNITGRKYRMNLTPIED